MSHVAHQTLANAKAFQRLQNLREETCLKIGRSRHPNRWIRNPVEITVLFLAYAIVPKLLTAARSGIALDYIVV